MVVHIYSARASAKGIGETVTRVTLFCQECGYHARRDLLREAGSRGVHETSAEPADCPRGHGPLRRIDGVQHPAIGVRARPWPHKVSGS